MITNLKERLKEFIDNRIALLKDQQRLNEQVHFDYNQISQLFKEDNFIPYTGWSVSPSLILHVLNDICIHKRKTIIEFGSGASTFYIAKLLKTLNRNVVFYSIESNKDWYEELKLNLKLYGLEEYVDLIHASLKIAPNEITYKSQEIWYDSDTIGEKIGDSKFDLVLVDGPIGTITPYARFSMMPFLLNQLSENCNVYLDDTNRLEEREISQKWAEDNSFNLHAFHRYTQLKRIEGMDEIPFQLDNLK